MKKILSLFLICIICCGVHAQRTEVYNQHIHTVQVIANNDYMCLPSSGWERMKL